MITARTLIAAGIIAMVTGPALAQQAPVQGYGEKDKDKTLVQQQAEKDAERAYKRSLGNVPDKAPVDPWGSARSAEAPKPPTKAAAKTAPAKPKSGSAPH
jgi:hypothetical protein